MKTNNRILFGMALVATALAGCNRRNDALPNYPPPQPLRRRQVRSSP